MKRWLTRGKRFLKKGEKRLINGERSMVKIGGIRTVWLVGEILKKKKRKKCKNVTCRGVFEQQKRKSIFGVSLIHFQKTRVFHQYIRPITFFCDSKV